MFSSIRKPIFLIAVFFVAYGAVSALRKCTSGESLSTWLPGLSQKPSERRPEKFTLPELPPLNVGNVELLSRLNEEYANLTRAVVPSVVSIDTQGYSTQRLSDFWGRVFERRMPTQGQGSGVIVSKEGHVVTNHHVVAGQQKFRILLHGGKSYTARLIGEDRLLDIAVLKIDDKGPFQPLKLGDSSQVQVGQLVFAVGNPFGLGETVTQGIISAKERSISDNQRDLFQTDAAINPGNSGGPLVNLRGEIIGINAAIFSPDRQNPGFQGVGFSIPSNDVRDTIEQILERGRPIRGFLGVQMRDLDLTLRSQLDYGGESGALVTAIVPGSPAEMAGLQQWDVIVSLDGKAIQSSNQLFSLIQGSRVGGAVAIEVWRGGSIVKLQAKISESDADATVPPEK
ncbi:MAG: trypsin-like peptidase domain-containing protein [Verrucomicrobia bacterium]|jgi:S1-C subfamily serine protease|nr:trypsin-like peptidase domain-containing protein [Verrucomicrobiota bacterium]